MIILRDDQLETVEKIRQAYRERARAPLLVAPCGFGKTVAFSFMARNHIDKGGRVMVLVHRQELLDQVSQTLGDFGVMHGFFAPGYPRNPYAKVHIASVFTVIRRLTQVIPPTLIIVDEAHHCAGGTTFGKIIQHFKGARILGVTATPFRLSGEGLKDYFDRLVMGPTVQELIEKGRLSRFRVFCPSTPDLSSVHKRTGDFVTHELETVVDRPSLTGDAVAHYRRHASGRQAVAFCVSVQHARHVAENFLAAGFPAQCIDGSMPNVWRRQVIGDFRSGRLKILTSCDLVSEGFDVPDIEVGISLRPTMSLGLWLQQFGRCLRTAPGKEEAIIFDHAGNALRHGLPTDEREYSLEGRRNAKQGERVPSVKICKKCFAANRSTALTCTQCGTEFEIKPREVSKKEGELEELSPEKMAALAERRRQGQVQSLEALIDLGRRRGYSNPEGWADHVWRGRQLKKQRKVNI